MLWTFRIFAIFRVNRPSVRSDVIFQNFRREIFNNSRTVFCLFIHRHPVYPCPCHVVFLPIKPVSAQCRQNIHCRHCRRVTVRACLVGVCRLWSFCHRVSVVILLRIGGRDKNGAIDFVLYYICVIFVSLYAITTAADVWLLSLHAVPPLLMRDCNYIIRSVCRIVEVKKSKSADINNNRATWFLLGLVFVLSLLFVVLEYTASDGSASDDEELLEDMSLDMEIYPSMDIKSFKAFMASSEDKRSHDKLKIVENEEQKTSEADIPDENVETSEFSEDAATSGNETIEGADQESDGTEEEPLSFRVVEQIPEFPGGMGAFIKWLSANLKYPESAKNRKIQGKVVVSFIVNKDGSISDEKVMKGINPLLDREALRVIKLMPKWKPGVENDKPCRTLFAIPIVFKI